MTKECCRSGLKILVCCRKTNSLYVFLQTTGQRYHEMERQERCNDENNQRFERRRNQMKKKNEPTTLFE